jgi:hypothetical protein
MNHPVGQNTDVFMVDSLGDHPVEQVVGEPRPNRSSGRRASMFSGSEGHDGGPTVRPCGVVVPRSVILTVWPW